DVAHRTENLLDLLRRGARPATDELLQLLFRARDALENAVELSVVGREDELDVAEVVADLESAATLLAGPARSTAAPTAAAAVEPRAAPGGGGRLVQVTLRAEAPLKGGRALLALKRAQALGAVQGVTPPQAGFESDDFDGRFSFRLGSSAAAAEIERAVRAAGDVEHVSVGGGGDERRAAAPRGGAAAAAGAEATPEKSRHIRVDLRRLDELMDLIGELVTVRGRLNELAAARRDAAVDDVGQPDERRRRGKPAEGEIVLAAVRERASVAISVSDDGRGIDRARILERARREGLVDAHAEALSDDQLLRVLARPGFSTAEAVTSVSGRGVGIDVAVTRIRALGGSIDIRTEAGTGTRLVLRLPVTLAVVRARIAGVGAERYALPLTYVAETVEFGVQPTTIVEGREAIVLRDRVVPLVHLRRLLGVSGDAPTRCPIIVLEMGERRSGIVVDGMLGQQEIVVKGFDAPQGTLPVFSGATIMGDGVPALILDAGGLL